MTIYELNYLDTVRMYLHNHIYSMRDKQAYCGNYTLVERTVICDAIHAVRNNSRIHDAIDNVALEVVERIL